MISISYLRASYTFLFPILSRTQVLECLKKYLQRARTGHYPRIIYAYNTAEYIGKEVKTIRNTVGGQLRTIIPYTQERNKISERFNRIKLDGVQTLLFMVKIDYSYWTYAACDVSIKQNLLTHSATVHCPYVQWTGAQPKMRKFYIYCQIFRIPALPRGQKLDSRSETVRLI